MSTSGHNSTPVARAASVPPSIHYPKPPAGAGDPTIPRKEDDSDSGPDPDEGRQDDTRGGGGGAGDGGADDGAEPAVAPSTTQKRRLSTHEANALKKTRLARDEEAKAVIAMADAKIAESQVKAQEARLTVLAAQVRSKEIAAEEKKLRIREAAVAAPPVPAPPPAGDAAAAALLAGMPPHRPRARLLASYDLSVVADGAGGGVGGGGAVPARPPVEPALSSNLTGLLEGLDGAKFNVSEDGFKSIRAELTGFKSLLQTQWQNRSAMKEFTTRLETAFSLPDCEVLAKNYVALRSLITMNGVTMEKAQIDPARRAMVALLEEIQLKKKFGLAVSVIDQTILKEQAAEFECAIKTNARKNVSAAAGGESQHRARPRRKHGNGSYSAGGGSAGSLTAVIANAVTDGIARASAAMQQQQPYHLQDQPAYGRGGGNRSRGRGAGRGGGAGGGAGRGSFNGSAAAQKA